MFNLDQISLTEKKTDVACADRYNNSINDNIMPAQVTF